MNSHQRDNSESKMYPVLQSKLKYLSCVSCKHTFSFRGSHHSRQKIPYLLECGHPICEPCFKRNASRTCATCESTSVEQNPTEIKINNLPPHLYILGSINASQSSLIRTVDSNIKFRQPESAKTRKSLAQDLEYCSECGSSADSRCRQCEVFFCNTCHKKIHGRALQNHQKISLTESASEICKLLSNICETHPNQNIQFYCLKCNVTACHFCLIQSHRDHRIVSHCERNDELKPQLKSTIEKVAEIVQRLKQTERKLTKSVASLSLETSQDEEQDKEKIEAKLVRHFIHLHGVLQNMEKRFLIQLQERQNSIANNIESIREQIKEQKLELETEIKTATAVLHENNSTANVQAIIDKLEQSFDVPCHLFRSDLSESKFQLLVDDNIVETITDHCYVEMPSVTSYSLLRTNELPNDYEMEPINREDVARLIVPVARTVQSKSNSVPISNNSSSSTTEPNQNRTSENVTITHIANPDLFYTQSLSRNGELIQLRNMLAKQASIATRPTELELNKLYMVQYSTDDKWYRGRIQKIYTNPNTGQQLADVFYVDYGNTQVSVPLEKMKNLAIQSYLIPFMARRCALHDIAAEDGVWSLDANKVMLAMVAGNPKLVQHTFAFHNNTYYVDIMKNSAGDGDRPTSIRDALIFLEYGCFITNEKLNRINPESIRKYFDEEVAIENSYGVSCTYIESPDCIYVQKIGEVENHLQKMTNDMTDEYNEIVEGTKGIIYTPQIGMPCAAPYTDDIWYRGKITNLLGNRRVEVFFVDFGLTQCYEYNKIRRLYNKYLSITALAIKVSLKDVESPQNNEWSIETVDFMNEHLLHKYLQMFVFSKGNDNSYKVTLYIPLDDKDVNFNALLVEQKFAISTGSSSQFIDAPKKKTRRRKKKCVKSKKSMKTSSEIEDEDDIENNVEEMDPFRMQVNILQAASPDCIYVADVGTEKSIRKMAEKLQDFYNSYKSEENEDWKKDDVCVAYSAKDKSYHRAKVIEVISAEKVTVFFYDTAITESVSVKDLQSLHSKFSVMPARAFKIRLAGILPCGDTNTWVSSSCEGLCDLINNNQHSKFYITKVAGIENDAIPVELWVRETRTEGPLAPTIVEINSINRMLVKKGIALPVRGYQEETNKVLAVDLRQQLQRNEENSSTINVEWLAKSQTDADYPLDITSDTSPVVTSVESDKDERDESDDDRPPIPPPFAAWIPAAPILDDTFRAVSTYVDQNCTIYLHSLKHNREMLSVIDSVLQDKYGNSTPEACDMKWAPNDLCIAQYHFDKKWYRAQVLEILDNDEVKVIFVDYGNVDECKIGTLRKRVMMGHIPIQATKCVVQGLFPNTPNGEWATRELDVIHATVVDKKSDVTVLERKPEHLVISMTLLSLDHLDLITYLREGLKLNIRNADNDDVIEKERSSSNFEMDNSESADVVIEECIPGYVPSAIEEPMIFDLCSPLSTKPVDEIIEVQHSDEAASMSTDSSELTVEMDEVVTTKDTTEAISDIEIPWFAVDQLPCEETIDVSCMVQSEEEENIEDENDCIVLSCSESNIPDSSELDEENSNDMEIIIRDSPEPSYEGLNYMEFNIPHSVEIIEIEPLHLESCTTFFAQLHVSSNIPKLDVYAQDLKDVSKSMQIEAADQPQLDDIRLFSPCTVQYKVDKLWYRAMILKFKPDSEEVLVQYVDYGNKEYQPINKLRCLKEKWLEVPVTVLKFRLWGIQVTGRKISKELSREFETILYSGVYTAKIKERSNKITAVSLYTDKKCTELVYSSFLENGTLEIAEEE